MATSTPTPTPAEPDSASEPATVTTVVSSLAMTHKSGVLKPTDVEVTCAPLPTRAVVVSSSTFTVAAPDTATLPPALPAAVMPISASLESALTRTPSLPWDVTTA